MTTVTLSDCLLHHQVLLNQILCSWPLD